MVFSSLFFLFLFLPANLLCYFSTNNRKIQNLVLVVFSLFFYAWGEPVWVGLLLFSALIDYLNGLFIEHHRGKPLARLGVVSTLIFNLGILAVFKYSDFLVDNLNLLAGGTYLDKPGFALPIGISFYTFQTISYTIDVYRGEVKAQRSFLDFLLFVSLFHQLVAGPIVRYSHVAHEIENRVFRWEDASQGVIRFCRGLFKKVVMANMAGELSSHFLDAHFNSLSLAGSWFGLILFSLQIFFDFSGYSDMAIGLGKMLGFHYHENFKYPYLSTSISDFWRRWHISLGSFFRDYVYIPLGGNRKHPVRNLLIVWFLTGLWHGASWNFILWGLYFGVLIYLEKVLIQRVLNWVPAFFRHVYALFFIVLGWALFYFTDLSQLGRFLSVLFNFRQGPLWDADTLLLFRENVFWLLLALFLCLPVSSWWTKISRKLPANPWLEPVLQGTLSLALFFVSVMLLVGSTYNPFLYFRF
jgi:alginate O-acetyltransferase complex protein AlgI